MSVRTAARVVVAVIGLGGGVWAAHPDRTVAAQSAPSNDVGAVIAREFPGFRIAQPSDYLAVLAERRGEPVIREDFNQDGLADVAVMVIDVRRKESRVYFLIASRTGYWFHHLFTRTWLDPSGVRPIRTPMFLKPAGDPGISGRMYNTLTPADFRRVGPPAPAEAADNERRRSLYRSVPAIEVWTGQHHDERDRDLEDIGYCSRTWYFARNQLKTFDACD